jgi:hypothetical protein
MAKNRRLRPTLSHSFLILRGKHASSETWVYAIHWKIANTSDDLVGAFTMINLLPHSMSRRSRRHRNSSLTYSSHSCISNSVIIANMHNSNIRFSHWVWAVNRMLVSPKLSIQFAVVTWMVSVVFDHLYPCDIEISSDVPQPQLTQVFTVLHDPFRNFRVSNFYEFHIKARYQSWGLEISSDVNITLEYFMSPFIKPCKDKCLNIAFLNSSVNVLCNGGFEEVSRKESSKRRYFVHKIDFAEALNCCLMVCKKSH